MQDHVAAKRGRGRAGAGKVSGGWTRWGPLLLAATALALPAGGVTKGEARPAAVPHDAAATPDAFVFGAAGDHARGDETVATLKTLRGAGTDFYLALGDFSYGGSETSWCDLVKSNVGGTYPFQLISGNHDDEAIERFTACLPDRIGVTGTYGQEYFFDFPKKAPLARFILISPDLRFGSRVMAYGKGDPGHGWLSAAIDDARAKGIPWVVVGMHKVCITAGVKSCEIGAELFNLLVTKKVDLVLGAHDHNYQRSKQIAATTACVAVEPGTFDASCVVDDGADGAYAKGAGSVVVIQGMFGQKLYEIKRGDDEAGYFAAMMGRNVSPTHGFVRYRVTRDEIAADFVASDKGGFKDAFSIKGGPGARRSSAPPEAGGRPAAASAGRGANPLVAATSGSTGSAGSPTLTIPAPPGVPGDVMLAVIGSDYGHVGAPPPGWRLIRQEVKPEPVDDLAIQAYHNVAGASEPPTYRWPLVTEGRPATNGLGAGTIMRFTGINQAQPVFGSGVRAQTRDRRRIECPSIDAPAGGVLVCGYIVDDPAVVSVPSHLEEACNVTVRKDDTFAVGYAVRPAAGPTGAGTASVGDVEGGGDDFGLAVVLSPRAGSPR